MYFRLMDVLDMLSVSNPFKHVVSASSLRQRVVSMLYASSVCWIIQPSLLMGWERVEGMRRNRQREPMLSNG